MSTNDTDQVNELFQTFQKDREQAPQAQQQAILDELRSMGLEPLSKGETEAEQAVLDQYRHYMGERDDNRQEVIAQVTAYAKSKAAEPSTEAIENPLAHVFQLPGQVLGRVMKWLGGLLSAGSQWQLALPALAMVAVVFWLSQSIEQDGVEPQRVAWNQSLPAGVEGSAQIILDQLQPTVPSSFGFTQQTGKLAAGFELGMAMADIELAWAAQSKKHLPGMVRRADKLAHQLGLPLLSAQLDLQEDSVSLNGIAQRWFGNNAEFSSLYQLGFWMESTQFALQLVEVAGEPSPMKESFSMLKASRSVWEKALVKHDVQRRQFQKLAGFKVESLETHYGRQMFTRQLERTIAVFKNL